MLNLSVIGFIKSHNKSMNMVSNNSLTLSQMPSAF